jgi:fatty-acyl-CoA synthase
MQAFDLLGNRARLTPDREALLELESGRRFTYAELNERACRAANFLRDVYGVGPGDRVSILAHNSVAFVDLFYGLAKIGAIFAPLNWRLVARELTYIVNDCTPRVLICGPQFSDVVAAMRPDVAPKLIAIDGAELGDVAAYDDLLAAATPEEPVRPPLADSDPHCILYTSGTTGQPKGAIIPYRQVLWNCVNTVISWGLTEHDVSPVLTPLFHAGGLFAFMTPLFYAGGRIVMAGGFDVSKSLQVIHDERCTVILGVPTLFQMWRESPEYASADFSHVRFFISGGAPCPVPLIAAWRDEKGVIFRQGYGLTEVGPNCFSMTDAESLPKAGSVGKPIFHSAMRLVGPDGADVGADAVGELAIHGPHVCAGYWQNPEATAKALRDGWFYTGDMARRDADGFYTIVGRFKDMIISGGENVYAAEVEAVFREHPAVAEAALIGQPDAKWGEVGVMIVVPEKGRTAEPDDLIAFCRERLARYKVPKRVIVAEGLPYSPYGKVIKSELREKYGSPEPVPAQREESHA